MGTVMSPDAVLRMGQDRDRVLRSSRAIRWGDAWRFGGWYGFVLRAMGRPLACSAFLSLLVLRVLHGSMLWSASASCLSLYYRAFSGVN